MDGWVDEWINGWMDKWMEVFICVCRVWANRAKESRTRWSGVGRDGAGRARERRVKGMAKLF